MNRLFGLPIRRKTDLRMLYTVFLKASLGMT